MLRRWVVRPRPGDFEVSREDMATALADAEGIIARCGGHLSVTTERARTDFPGEAVTIAALFEWRDRTDARPAPERTVEPDPEPDPDPEPEPREIVMPLGEPADGLVVTEEEDVSSIPVGQR